MRFLVLAGAVIFYVSIQAQEKNQQKISDFKIIPEILVKPTMGVMRISRDTIEFRIAEVQEPGVLKVEDLFRQFLGFHVTDDGRIYFNGKEVTVILIDGDPLSVFDYRVVTKHLNANMFKTVELIQNYHSNRFQLYSLGNNEVAVNLKMKNGYGNKVNADASLMYTINRKFLGALDASRIGTHIKSILFFEKNQYADRINVNTNDVMSINPNALCILPLIESPSTLQTLSFKKEYLPNNNNQSFKFVHALNFSSYHKFHVEASNIQIKQTNREEQLMHYSLLGLQNRIDVRKLILSQFEKANSIRLSYVHDHLKNNHGEYAISIGMQNRNDYLFDTMHISQTYINEIFSDQYRSTISFAGNEKFLLRGKFLVDIKFQTGINYLKRDLIGIYGDQKQNNLFQKYLFVEAGTFLRWKRHSYQIALRKFNEARDLGVQFNKQYFYVDHQYVFNKKLKVLSDASFGAGKMNFQGDVHVKPIYQLQGQLIYTKSIYNHFYVSYFKHQSLPKFERWLATPFYHLSNQIEYFIHPDHFTKIEKAEFGKWYHNLYKGFRYGYSFSAYKTDNNEMRAIGFEKFYVLDTIKYDGKSTSFHVRGEIEQFVLSCKMRFSLGYQYASIHMLQSLFGENIPINIRQHSLKFTSKSVWEKKVHVEVTSMVQYSIGSFFLSSNLNMVFNHEANLKYKFNKKVYAGMHTFMIHQYKGKQFNFIDFNLQLQPLSSITMQLSILNVLNYKQYEQRNITNTGIQTIQSQLAGRKIQLVLKKSL